MKKTLLFTILTFLVITLQAQDVFQSTTGEVSFFSKTPVEDIDATCNKLATALNVKTKKFAFKVTITNFEFKKSLMQEHFNENYMESKKFPKATFEGEITDAVDLTKPGTYNVKAKGKLNIHGVEQERIIDAVVTVSAADIKITSDFKVKLVDHKIEVPKLVFEKIAETIDVSVKTTLKPVEKK